MIGPGFDAVEVGCVEVSMEMTVLVAFALGYFCFRSNPFSRPCVTSKAINENRCEAENATMTAVATMVEDEIAIGNYEAAVNMWRATKNCFSTPAATLRLVLKALHRSSSDDIVQEITEHMSFHSCHLGNPAVAAIMLEAASNEGDLALVEDLLTSFETHFGFSESPQVREAMISSYAAADASSQLIEFLGCVHSMGQKVTLRGYSLALKGFLQNRNLDAALVQAHQIIFQGYMIPSFAVAGVFKLAFEINRLEEVLGQAQDLRLTPSVATISDLIQYCDMHGDALMAHRIEALAAFAKVQLNSACHCGLLQVYVSAGDHRALELLDTVHMCAVPLQTSFYNNLLARSAVSHFESFSQLIQDHLAGLH